MELHIPAYIQHKLPYAFLFRTLSISTPHSCCAKIASYTLKLSSTPALINRMPQSTADKARHFVVCGTLHLHPSGSGTGSLLQVWCHYGIGLRKSTKKKKANRQIILLRARHGTCHSSSSHSSSSDSSSVVSSSSTCFTSSNS